MATKLVKSQVGSLNFHATLTEYEETLEVLRKIGVSISPHGRLESYRKTLSTMVGASGVGLLGVSGDLRSDVSVALVEVTEINDIGRAFRTRPSDAFMERLRVLGKGQKDADDELHAKGRDAQFELWLAAMLKTNKAKVHAGTPDLTVKTPHGRYCLEAKRLTSAARFDDRLHEAVSAIEKVEENGAAIFSIDQVVRPKHQIAFADSKTTLERNVGAILSEFSTRHDSVVKKRTEGTTLSAVILSLRMPAVIGRSRQHTVYQSLHIHPTARGSSAGTKALNWIVETIRRVNLPD